MTIPHYETIRVVHPSIPGSEHDVPLASLAIMQRSGWVRADQEPEVDEEKEAPKAPDAKEESKPSAKPSSTSSGRTTSKKGEEN